MSRLPRGKHLISIGIGVCLCVFLLICIKQFASSAFFSSKDRINVLFYTEAPIYYSLQKRGEIHYFTTFSADCRTDVPGGYGVYRIGALGKLVHLENQPDLFRRTFSRITGSMLTYYFYPSKTNVYYGSKEKVSIPTFSDIFFTSSNATFFDRLFVFMQFFGKRSSNFERVVIKKVESNGDILLSDKAFQTQYIGFFYSKTLREENKTIQILYSDSYEGAVTVSRIIDGEGMRVVDIDEDEHKKKGKHLCIVTENTQKEFSLTTRVIGAFFNCQLERAQGSLSDIVVYLGNIENTWK